MKTVLGMVLMAAAALGQGIPLPYTKIQFFSNSGQPLAGGTACTSTSGTTSPLATFTDYTLGTANPQCVPLDSAGRASIWLDPTKLYRVVLKDSTGVTLWTQDGVNGALGGGGGGGTLWAQSGSTIYNAVLGTKVCIAPTACTTGLAQLDVAGTSAGTAGLIRIDDTGTNPGLSLYGGGSAMGTYGANSSGLQLRAPDGTSQLNIGTGTVTAFNGGSSGGTNLRIKMNATQGGVNPVEIQNNAGSNIGYIDSSGNAVLPGFAATGTAINTIQAPAGGVTAQDLVATDSLFFIEEAPPALSASGQARIYANSTSHTLLISQNGAAYVPLGSGGGGSTTFDLIGTGTNVTATMTVGTGGTLTRSGSGHIDADKINATTVPTSPAADMILITTGAGVGAWSGATLNSAGLANCVDTGGNHLNYNTSTHIFTCGTSGGTVGSVSFGTITSATNTVSAMVVGTGASLTTSGTGTINATQINAGTPPVSGSVWKSNGSLQPIQSTFADIVAMFSGGSGCSGSNALAADGTCVAAGGGGPTLAGTNSWTGQNTYNTPIMQLFGDNTTGGGVAIRNAGLLDLRLGSSAIARTGVTFEFSNASTLQMDSGSQILLNGASSLQLSTTALFNIGGRVSSYDNRTVFGMGVAPIYYAASSVGNMSSIGTTQITVGGGSPPAGFYRVSIAAPCIFTSGTLLTSSTISLRIGSVADALGFNLNDTSQTCAANSAHNFSAVVYTNGGAAGGCNGLCWATNVSGSFATGWTSYSVYVTAERLQ